MINSDHLTHLLRHARRKLRSYPHVIGVGFGWKEVRGELTEQPALRVYVREKLTRAQLMPAAIIPQELAGLRTDVLPAVTGIATSNNEPQRCGPLAAGAAVSNLRGVLGHPPAEAGGSGLGALGFFAAVNNTTARLEVVLVSNRHVLLAHGARAGDPVYQPRYTCQNGTYSFHRDSLHPIAEIADEGLAGNYAYSYPGEGRAEYFIDCATARLLIERGVRYQPAHITRTACGTTLLKGLTRAHALDMFAGRELRVRKLGPTTGLTFGRVVDVAAPALSLDEATTRENNLLIRPVSPSAGSFAADGDSGALVLDDQNRAVGLLWGQSRQSRGAAFACHIHPLLDRLNVTPITYDPFQPPPPASARAAVRGPQI